MDAYVLGTHDGELPTHLLGHGDNRVRAMARLDGPDHNVFYALEVPNAESVDGHVSAIGDAGSIVGRILIIDGNIAAVVIHPSHMPPWERYLFLLLELEAIEEALAAARDILGEGGVAAAADSQGHILVELGGNDAAALQEAAALFGGAAHAVGAGGIVRS